MTHDSIIAATWRIRVKVKKVKVVNLYSALGLCVHVFNALFVTNQSRRPHGQRVQPADTD